MKKSGLIIVAAVAVVLAVGGFLLVKSSKNETGSTASSSTSTAGSGNFNPPKACDVLTQEVATQALGTAEKADLPMDGSAASDDIEVTQCIYSQPSGDTIESIKTRKQASILVRGAKTKTGAESNQFVFDSPNLPANVVNVPGYGNAAFWNPEFGQLNIHKNNNWYILTLGVNDIKQKTLDETKKLADLVNDKL